MLAGGSVQYRYNGKERDTVSGWYEYGARWYIDEIGRWNGVDPLTDHPNQVDKSPYTYAWNNPVLLNDPDGNCPFCPALLTKAASGFVAGAAIDYGMQVAGNLVIGKQDLGTAMTDVSVGSIMISGFAGAVSGGVAAPLSLSGKKLPNGDLQLSVSKKLKMTDYKMEPPVMLLGTIKVGNEITVEFDFVLERVK
ncbi:MAG: hypothetical protein KF852_15085 [Saprospiraceae bacterium]|nr:hypothetical protein [Saprospiraceae bacterium]